MATRQTVLLVGGTGRTGRRVLHELLERDVAVRAIVRPGRTFAPELAHDTRLTRIEASLLALSDDALQRHAEGCDAVVSCLGHVLDFRGVFGPPRDLVTRATARLCRAIETVRPARPVRFVLMSSVSVDRAGGSEAKRTALDRACLRVIGALLPPARDNQFAADVLQRTIGAGHPFVQWVVVRPDTLLPGEASRYELHEGIVSSLFTPGSTRMANVAHFMCELVTDTATWSKWRSKLPVILDAASPTVPRPRSA